MRSLNFKYLVIEDDTNVWGNIERRMKHFSNWKSVGFSAEIEDSINIIQSHKPHLIFSDWSIKGGNSFQILNFIKTIENYNPFIIFFTGYQSDHPEIPQQVMNDFPMVKKYIVKPIFENFTENLHNYIREAEEHVELFAKKNPIFIENDLRQLIKIIPEDSVAIIQSEENARIKILHLKNGEQINLKTTWQNILNIMEKHEIDYQICHNRKSIVNKVYITKVSKPYIWLENDLKIRVSRECWEGFI